jgi:hypothetical protein
MKRIAFASILCTSLFCTGALGWGPAGHKIVASVAYRQLTPEQQQKIVAILKHNPRYIEDFKNRMPPGVEEDEWIFQQAAIWPDLVKGLAPDLKKKFSRPEWHFIDLPYYPTDDDRHELEGHFSLNISFAIPKDESEKMNVVQAIGFARRILDDAHSSDEDKGKFLSWLFHLVGDAHQPLHAATLCTVDVFPKGDHGGNFIPTKPSKELHAVWDGFPGNPGMKFRAVKNKAIGLTGDPALRTVGEKAAENLSAEAWVKESHALAESEGYTQEVLEHLDGHSVGEKLPSLELSDDYLSNGGEVAQTRLVEAGYRLGAMLKKAAGD